MAAPRAKVKRGIVLLYAVTVFAVIASIGLTIMDSGEFFVGNVRLDYHTMVAQQAALSGIAYGEATIQRMLDLSRSGTFEDTDVSPPPPRQNPHVSMPAWAGRDFDTSPFVYVPLLGAKGAAGTPSDQTSYPIVPNTDAWTTTFTIESRGGVETERARFRIELRECSRPTQLQAPYGAPPAPFIGLTAPSGPGCGDFLYDENLLRNDFFWLNGSPYKPAVNPQAFGLLRVNDFFIMYTMRVEGEALPLNPATNAFDTVAASVVVKETFTFRPEIPNRFFAQAFWYHDLQRGY